jgi:hypothetical protein
MNTIDITNFSDNLVDAIFAYRSGDESFDFDVLTVGELYALQDAVKVDLGLWIRQANLRSERSKRPVGPDYENAILARQERDAA